MGYDATLPGLDRAQIEQARNALKSLLKRFGKEMRTTGKEMAIDFLCTGIEAIPVPVLNVALSKSVRRMLEGAPGSPPADLQELLQILEDMQRSDEQFEQGIALLRVDLAEVAADVRAIRQEMTDQKESRLALIGVKTELNWPVSDTTISALLANTGGGSVVVDEIFLHVESWQPEPTVNYSVPAAPLLELHLQAQLRTSEADYPLFKLNRVGSRLFEERGAGAERIVIDLSSPENVRYAVRLEVPYTEITTGSVGSLFWPPAGEPPLTLSFVCGPGWQPVEVGKLHGADTIYADMSAKLVGLTGALAARPAEPGYDPEFEARMEKLGIPSYTVDGGPIFGSFLRSFVPLFAQLAPGDDRQRALSIVASLLAAAPKESLFGLSADSPVARALVELARRTPNEQTAVELASRLGDPAVQAALKQLAERS